MKEFSPGASIHDDYVYFCDVCETKDSKRVLIWKKLPDRKGHFAICMDCISKLYFQYVSESQKIDESIEIKRKSINENIRNSVFSRDGYKCLKCGSDKHLVLDHIIPFSKGGTTSICNLQTLCSECNKRKSDHLL